MDVSLVPWLLGLVAGLAFTIGWIFASWLVVRISPQPKPVSLPRLPLGCRRREQIADYLNARAVAVR